MANLEDWLNKHFSVQSVSRELPLLALDENGSVVSGTADLVVETADGAWIIDHKSDQVDDQDVAFIKIPATAGILCEGATVLGVGINWIRRSEVVLERI